MTAHVKKFYIYTLICIVKQHISDIALPKETFLTLALTIFKNSDMAWGGDGGVYLLEAAFLDTGTINILPQSQAELLLLLLHHGQLPLHYQDVLKKRAHRVVY